MTQNLCEYIREKQLTKPMTLMTHIVVGYPSLEANWEVLEQMEKAGVEIVEFQFPFSEPVADGPLFAMANQESIERGTNLNDCFALIRKASERFSFKILMMGYYNTIFKTGEKEFCERLTQAGASGMIVADLPISEAAALRKIANQSNLAFIYLVTPTTTETRLDQIAKMANDEGTLVYAVARKGTTGQSTSLSDIEQYLQLLKSKFSVPVAVGFGISSREDVDWLCGRADMSILGTQVLRVYNEQGASAVGEFLLGLR